MEIARLYFRKAMSVLATPLSFPPFLGVVRGSRRELWAGARGDTRRGERRMEWVDVLSSN